MILLQIADEKRLAKRIHFLQDSGRLDNFEIADHLGITRARCLELIKKYPRRVSNIEGASILLTDKVMRS